MVKQTDEVEPLLKRIAMQQDQTNILLQKILATISGPPVPPTNKVISTIKLFFKGVPMPPVIPGPVVLTQVGQQVVADVVAYDQFGNLWTGTMPSITLTNDNESAATLDATSGTVTAVANGVSNITAELVTAEGLDLTDTESVTVNIQAAEPVITTVKVVFTTPARTKGKK
ncbi:MAG TPA: hypothetical protein VII99_16510 [Bacteroidia bacterium]